ncbi:MAG: DUF1080 domain-containing protein [Planctomycetes bacterium]|nr:DUF1080 domain-containing protein [Planctomycetota bacterium]
MSDACSWIGSRTGWVCAAVVACSAAVAMSGARGGGAWLHEVEISEPAEPKKVACGEMGVPSDAKVLLAAHASDAKEWNMLGGKPARWKVTDGVMVVEPGSGNVRSGFEFGDCQLHIEFRTPSPASGEGQNRGNSGVYLHGKYEVQVLDSFGDGAESKTYADGQCGAIYKVSPPLVNVSKAPGEWQTYDIVFTAPKFDAAGKKTSSARLTVLHNGVLIQHDVEVKGPTGAAAGGEEMAMGPLMLQDHGSKVEYRNIWVRNIGTDASAGHTQGK